MTDEAVDAAPRGTLIVSMTVDAGRADEVDRHFREDVRPWARSQPGFVSAQWVRASGGSRGMGIVVFGTEDQAQAASIGPRSQQRVDGRAWNTDAVDVYSVIAEA